MCEERFGGSLSYADYTRAMTSSIDRTVSGDVSSSGDKPCANKCDGGCGACMPRGYIPRTVSYSGDKHPQLAQHPASAPTIYDWPAILRNVHWTSYATKDCDHCYDWPEILRDVQWKWINHTADCSCAQCPPNNHTAIHCDHCSPKDRDCADCPSMPLCEGSECILATTHCDHCSPKDPACSGECAECGLEPACDGAAKEEEPGVKRELRCSCESPTMPERGCPWHDDRAAKRAKRLRQL